MHRCYYRIYYFKMSMNEKKKREPKPKRLKGRNKDGKVFTKKEAVLKERSTLLNASSTVIQSTALAHMEEMDKLKAEHVAEVNKLQKHRAFLAWALLIVTLAASFYVFYTNVP